MQLKFVTGVGLAALAFAAAPAAAETLLLRDPALSAQNLAFVYAGDLYVANRDGSAPRRLTSHAADERDPIFSPDGTLIAYTANYDGNTDVYVIPTAGGQPKRLTWHPGADTAVDWAPDGQSVAFVSRRETGHGRSEQLFHVSLSGGLPVKQMEARVFRGAYDESGGRFALMPYPAAYNGLFGGGAGWRGYEGGTAPALDILDLNAKTSVTVPGPASTNFDPMWMGGQLYFLSDRDNKVFNIHRFDPATGAVSKVSNETVWDIRNADAHGGTIVYEAGGRLKALNTADGSVRELTISLTPDLPQLRPQWKDAKNAVSATDISPSGKRVAVVARGEVFTLPVEDGAPRNITNSMGVREYTAVWSPDGQKLAYIVERDGRQFVRIEDQAGLEAPRELALGPDFYSLHAWGEGGRLIVESNHLELFALAVADGKRTTIGKGARREQFEADVSPDGRWLAYTEERPNFNRDLYLFDFTLGRGYRVTDGFADVGSPAFSKDGKLLFFTGSTNSGPAQVGLDMSSQERPYRAGIYVAMLEAEGKSPLAPKLGDEEPAKKDEPAGKKKGSDAAKAGVAVSPDGLMGRIEALPVPEHFYADLGVAKDGTLYFVRRVQPGVANTPPGQPDQGEAALMRFNFDKREAQTVLGGVTGLQVAASGEHALLQKADGSFATAKIAEKLEPKPLDLSGARLFIDPKVEWAQIFDDVWRMEAAYFYDPAMHGLDWAAVRDRYKPLLAHVGRREDLNELMVEMIAEMQVGHNRVGGGDVYQAKEPSVGLLGADLRVENGRYRIARIHTGGSWNPFLKSPLAAPGVGAKEGDYILAINGRELGPNDNIFEFLSGTVDSQIAVRLAPTPDGRNARTVTVEPIGNEGALRLWSWIEANRQAVDKASNGKVGYVYLPDTGGNGYTFFNRMFFAQVDKDAIIIDERSNGGGQAANYITDVLNRTYLAGWKDRDGLVFNTPGGAIYGPKVMLIDQDAGSGGDFLPYSFREMGIGTLIGTRTWGGLIGISANPSLVDGGLLSVPFFRFFDTKGRWSVENEGVAPDIEVKLDPVAANQGRDTQLERAIQEVLRQLQERPSPAPLAAPAYPTRLGE